LDIPLEFKRFGSQYFQGSEQFADFRKEDEMIRFGLEGLSRETQISLKNFLTELLKSKPSHQKLAEMWEATGTDFYFSRGLDRFLAMTRDAIPD